MMSSTTGALSFTSPIIIITCACANFSRPGVPPSVALTVRLYLAFCSRSRHRATRRTPDVAFTAKGNVSPRVTRLYHILPLFPESLSVAFTVTTEELTVAFSKILA